MGGFEDCMLLRAQSHVPKLRLLCNNSSQTVANKPNVAFRYCWTKTKTHCWAKLSRCSFYVWVILWKGMLKRSLFSEKLFVLEWASSWLDAFKKHVFFPIWFLIVAVFWKQYFLWKTVLQNELVVAWRNLRKSILTSLFFLGGDPAAGSPTATLLRLFPPHRA